MVVSRASTSSSSVAASVARVAAVKLRRDRARPRGRCRCRRGSRPGRPRRCGRRRPSTATTSSHGWSRPAKNEAASSPSHDRRAGSSTSGGGVIRSEAQGRLAEQPLAQGERVVGRGRARTAGLGAGAGDDDLVPEQPDDGVRRCVGGTAKALSPSRIVVSGRRSRPQRLGAQHVVLRRECRLRGQLELRPSPRRRVPAPVEQRPGALPYGRGHVEVTEGQRQDRCGRPPASRNRCQPRVGGVGASPLVIALRRPLGHRRAGRERLAAVGVSSAVLCRSRSATAPARATFGSGLDAARRVAFRRDGSARSRTPGRPTSCTAS